jgi:hypothetical protein
MIEVWLDEDNNEVFFCMGGLIDLHIKTGTVPKNVKKIDSYPTTSMPEAHKMFQEKLRESNDQLLADTLQEGWD